MNVLWLSHRDITNTNAGGAERTIYEVGKRLVEKGHHVTWYSVAQSNIEKNDAISGMRIVRARSNLSAHLNVAKLAKKEVPDVIVDDLGHAVPWFAERITKIKGTVFFRHLHRRSLKGQVPWPSRTLISGLEAMYPKIYKKWDFVTESDSSISDLVDLGVRKERIKRIPPGLNTEQMMPREKFDQPTIVYFGGFRDYKRPDEPVHVLKKLLNDLPGLRLIMVGAGPSQDRVRELSKKLDLEDNIKFTGRLSDAELYDIVSRSWVNLHCSVTEGFGYSILEASALGTPTVAYRVPGVRDAIETNSNGFLVNDGDIDAFTRQIEVIINSDLSDWTESARTFSLRYSWGKTADMWEEHLNNVRKD